MTWLGHYNYWFSIFLMCAGLYAVINGGNLVKKLMGLGIFQTSVLLFYISMGYVQGGHFPILEKEAALYINPLPHVLMLTAIVVGVATFAVGLAIAVRIKETYGTIEENEILKIDHRSSAFQFKMMGVRVPKEMPVAKDISARPKKKASPPKKKAKRSAKPSAKKRRR